MRCFAFVDSVELFIDNQLVGIAQLPPNSLTIGSMRGAEGGLYIGGIPFGMSGDGMAASLFPFRGCLVDLLVNELYASLDMSPELFIYSLLNKG